jgi:hypothetical protein
MVRQSVVIALLMSALVGSAEAQTRDRDRSPRRGPSTELTVQGLSPESGAPGTTITIQGTFPGDATVVIGGRSVTPKAVHPRRLQFDVPDNLRPGSHAVTVRAPNGRADAGSFRVEPAARRGAPRAEPQPEPQPEQARRRARRGPPPEAPVISGFAPRSGTAGTEVTIRGRNLDDDALEVVFDDKAIEPKRRSARAITFDVPRGASEGTIVLRRPRRPNMVVGNFEVTKTRPKGKSRKERYEEQKKQEEAQWETRRKQLAKDRQARLEELRRQEEELARSREERRRRQAAALAAKFERDFRAQPDVQAELALHAERSARLDRMLRLAEAQAEGGLVVRIRILQRQETERHEQRMNDLRLSFRSR